MLITDHVAKTKVINEFEFETKTQLLSPRIPKLSIGNIFSKNVFCTFNRNKSVISYLHTSSLTRFHKQTTFIPL